MDKIAKGKEILAHLFGAESIQHITQSLDRNQPGYSDYMFYSYGEFYGNATLDLKTKELIVIAALITQKGAFPQLKGHLNGCKQAGLTKQEVCSAITHLTMYIGFPAVVNALMLVDDVFNENKA